MKKILVVNVNWLGDVIFSSPIFKALKEAYPQSTISCLAPPRVKEILESIPFLDEVIVYDEEREHFWPWQKLALINRIRKEYFEAVFVLHRSWTKAFLVYLAGIPVRVGYATKNRQKLLTHAFEESLGTVHRSDYYLQVIEKFGVKVSDRRTFLKIDQSSSEKIGRQLKQLEIDEKDFLVVINPGGNWDLKRYPKEKFTKVLEQFAAEKNIKIVVSGSPADQELVNEIVKPLGHKPAVLTGQMNLKELIALMKRADLVISADSGPLHIASSVGTKTIALFGPTRPEITGPRGKGEAHILQFDVGCNRQACYYLQCPDNTCMKSISVYDILQTFRKIKNT